MIVYLRGRRMAVSPRRLMTAAFFVLAGLVLSISALAHDGGPAAFFNLEAPVQYAGQALGLAEANEGQVAAGTPRDWVVNKGKDAWSQGTPNKEGHFWSGGGNIGYGIAAIVLGLLASAVALVTARKFYGDVKAAAPGNERMQEIAGAIREAGCAPVFVPASGSNASASKSCCGHCR